MCFFSLLSLSLSSSFFFFLLSSLLLRWEISSGLPAVQVYASMYAQAYRAPVPWSRWTTTIITNSFAHLRDYHIFLVLLVSQSILTLDNYRILKCFIYSFLSWKLYDLSYSYFFLIFVNFKRGFEVSKSQTLVAVGLNWGPHALAWPQVAVTQPFWLFFLYFFPLFVV